MSPRVDPPDSYSAYRQRGEVTQHDSGEFPQLWMQNTTKGRVDGGFAELLRRRRGWFLRMTLAALAVRLFFILRFPLITPDSLVYGDFAKNWLLHGIYGQSFASGAAPSYIRLPGYPAFLAALFAVFGMDHYGAARFVQLFVDVATCFVIADLARRLLGHSSHIARGERAARWAFALAVFCPFLANYTAVPLTETWAIFFTALALDCAVAGLQLCCPDLPGEAAPHLRWWVACGLAIAAGIYLRPDGGMLLIAIGGYLLVRWLRTRDLRLLRAGLLLGLCALAPLIPWTLRNWRAFHRFQPLAPVNANGPEEFFPYGFFRWEKTWIADYASQEDVSFHVDGEPISFSALPSRAFDGAGQRQRTEALFNAYNETLDMTPELDAQFAGLARERIRQRPLRYYLGLPLLRAADMWLRPRTEMLPLNPHWWWIKADPLDSAWSLLLAAINAAYLTAALIGWRRWASLPLAAMLAAFVVVRTVLITALGAVEQRYMLECFPVVLVFAAGALARLGTPLKIAEGARLKAQGARL